MNTAVINIKTDRQVKAQAQQLAEQLGFSLSSILNAYLKDFIKSKTIHYSLNEEAPTQYMMDALKESAEDIKAGRVISFDELKDGVTYLDKIIADEDNKD